MDSEATDVLARIRAVVQQIPGGGVLFAVVLLCVLGYFGWYYYGAEHLDQALYSLRLDKIDVTQQPEWIKGDVKEEVFQAGRLDRISLLDPRANAAVAQAFETHNWVKSTTRVSKAAGGRVIVDLVYRRPAAMVYYQKAVDGQNTVEIAKGFFPIDEEGTVLPTQDFSKQDVWDYFMIFAENARPAGDVGMPYGDVRISEALSLCQLLEPHRVSHRLQEIWVTQEGTVNGPSPWTLVVVSRDQREAIWGYGPRHAQADDLSVEEKMNRLLAWFEQPAATRGSPAKRLDLRHRSAGGSPVAVPLPRPD